MGLNRNAGEVIELRLRTDSYDGYRDYKIIRKTLCHELSHNVWGEHDRNFWDLTKEIEQEVERNDTLHGGHRVSKEAEFYNPNDSYDEAEHADHGGWTGGDFVLGGSTSDTGLSRREIIARVSHPVRRNAVPLIHELNLLSLSINVQANGDLQAAESRMRKEREAQERQDSPSSS